MRAHARALKIPLTEWRRPVDGALAFALRAVGDGFVPTIASAPCDIRAVARTVLVADDADRFERAVSRWSGPEDVVGADGQQPYVAAQLEFEEHPWRAVLRREDLERVLAGSVRVMRRTEIQTDYVLRDHHMLDVALYHYRTTGELPRALFHADRHSDWCTDGYLAARVPPQAATWWALFAGLKRPGGEPVLADNDVFFTTALAGGLGGRDVGASTRVPWWVDREDLRWDRALARPGATEVDWLSVDLDLFQPAPQLALTKGLLRDPRFRAILLSTRVRVFVLSPQFTNGGDRVTPWVVHGSIASSLRLINLLRFDV